MNKIHQIIIVLFFLILFGIFSQSYSYGGSPTGFGNLTLTTCYIGGDPGNLWCINNLTANNSLCIRSSCIHSWDEVNQSVTLISGNQPYLYNDSSTMYFNETKMNATIQNNNLNLSKINNAEFQCAANTYMTNFSASTESVVCTSITFPDKAGDQLYLYNDSTTIYFNETKLNATIEILDSDTYNTSQQMIDAVNGSALNLSKSFDYPESVDNTGGWTNTSVETNTSLKVNIDGNLDVDGTIDSEYKYILNGTTALSILNTQTGGSDNVLIATEPSSMNRADYNVFIGANAGEDITDADNNVFIGANAGKQQTGSDNIFIGLNSGLGPALGAGTGQKNVGMGSGSLSSLISGIGNFGLGYSAGSSITSGNQNTFIGAGAGSSVSTANYNIGIGYSALNQESLGHSNLALGYLALIWSNGGYYNTAIGREAGKGVNKQTTGDYNTFIGSRAGFSFTTAQRNWGAGHQALYNLTSGQNNFVGGYLAGQALTTGSGNVFLGSSVGATNFSGATSNTLVIDNSDTGSPLILGDFANDDLTINGDLNVTGNLEVQGCIRYNCSGGCITLGTCT